MAENKQLTEKLQEALTHIPHVTEKKMFGRIGFFVNKKLLASAGDDEYMFRIDPSFHEEAIQKNGVRTMVMKGKEYKGYVRVKDTAVPSSQDLTYWVELALDFNKTLVTKKK